MNKNCGSSYLKTKSSFGWYTWNLITWNLVTHNEILDNEILNVLPFKFLAMLEILFKILKFKLSGPTFYVLLIILKG